MTDRPRIDRPASAQALVLLSRYSAEITAIAAEMVGRGEVDNRDVQLLLAVHGAGSITPTDLAARIDTAPSVVSRALGRLEGAGLVARTRDAGDRRSFLVTVTGRGRRRVAAFADRLGAYFATGEPLLKELGHLLGLPAPEGSLHSPVDPLRTAAEMGRVGAEYVDDVTRALEPYGVHEFNDRYALLLIHVSGEQRPSQVADELGLSPSGVSGLLNRLDAAGLITRRHDTTPGDRRAVKVGLTPKGVAAVDVQLDTFPRHASALATALRLV